MDWTKPEHMMKKLGCTTQEKEIFKDGDYNDDVSTYVVHNNSFGMRGDKAFDKMVEGENTATRLGVFWDYDLVNGPGSEGIEIHISERGFEKDLLDGLIGKTKQALAILESRRSFLQKRGQARKRASRKEKQDAHIAG